MSLDEIKTAVLSLSQSEKVELWDWIEDQLELNPKFKAELEQSERERAEGRWSRIRYPSGP